MTSIYFMRFALAWRQRREKHAALALLARAEALQATQPSLAADLRAAAEGRLAGGERAQARGGMSSPRCTAGRATKASSTRRTWGKSTMPTSAPAS